MQRIEHHFVAMGGPGCFRIDSEDTALAQLAIQAAEEEVRRLERKYSRYLPDSLASQINRGAGKGVAQVIDSETSALLQFAHTLWRESGGLFDPTSGVLRRAWDFRSGRLPATDELARLLELVGWQRVQREPLSVYLPLECMELDFGGYVKEYAVDCAAAQLRAHGIESALVDLAGDMVAVGSQRDGFPWRVGIRGPGMGNRAVSRVELSNCGLASSGNYERCIELGGKRYGHILHPATGWPVQGLAGISITAPQCLVAGACATIAMLLVSNEARDWLSKIGLPWMAIDADGELFAGRGFSESDESAHPTGMALPK